MWMMTNTAEKYGGFFLEWTQIEMLKRRIFQKVTAVINVSFFLLF